MAVAVKSCINTADMVERLNEAKHLREEWRIAFSSAEGRKDRGKLSDAERAWNFWDGVVTTLEYTLGVRSKFPYESDLPSVVYRNS